MTSIAQRQELQAKIWKIDDDVRGSVDGWDFKQFVLGTLIYRFISENFTNYIEGGDDSVNYANYPDKDITPEINDDAIKTKGYFIYPRQLFVNITKTANTNPNLNTDLKAIYSTILSVNAKNKRRFTVSLKHNTIAKGAKYFIKKSELVDKLMEKFEEMGKYYK